MLRFKVQLLATQNNFLHVGHSHLPLGTSVSLTHSRWNHCVPHALSSHAIMLPPFTSLPFYITYTPNPTVFFDILFLSYLCNYSQVAQEADTISKIAQHWEELLKQVSRRQLDTLYELCVVTTQQSHRTVA